MKIIIDTDKKTISLEDNTNLELFFNDIKKLLPSGYWKEFELITKTNYLYYYNYPWINYYSSPNSIPFTITPAATGVYYLDNNTTSLLNKV